MGTERGLRDEGERRQAYALHACRHDLRLSRFRVSPRLQEHLSPPWAGCRDYYHAGRRLRDAVEGWGAEEALRVSRRNRLFAERFDVARPLQYRERADAALCGPG